MFNKINDFLHDEMIVIKIKITLFLIDCKYKMNNK